MTIDTGNPTLDTIFKHIAERHAIVEARYERAHYASLHEAYGVLLEEVDELWVEIKKRSENRSEGLIIGEYYDIIVAAIKGVETTLSKNYRAS